jgi:hypothetical protein
LNRPFRVHAAAALLEDLVDRLGLVGVLVGWIGLGELLADDEPFADDQQGEGDEDEREAQREPKELRLVGNRSSA